MSDGYPWTRGSKQFTLCSAEGLAVPSVHSTALKSRRGEAQGTQAELPGASTELKSAASLKAAAKCTLEKQDLT